MVKAQDPAVALVFRSPRVLAPRYLATLGS
jgi:hypothetical protein